MRNYNEDCRDDDFFDVMRNCFDHDKAVELVEAAYSPAELDEMGKARSRACRLDLSDSLDDVFCALWNNDGSRDKCRAVLDAARERGCDRVTLHAWNFNREAFGFYEKLGMTPLVTTMEQWVR